MFSLADIGKTFSNNVNINHSTSSAYSAVIDGAVEFTVPAVNPPDEIVDIIAPEGYNLERCGMYESMLNQREQEKGGNRRYRVFPFGTQLSTMKHNDNYKAVIKCAHCGQFGAVGCACSHCGAPIG